MQSPPWSSTILRQTGTCNVSGAKRIGYFQTRRKMMLHHRLEEWGIVTPNHFGQRCRIWQEQRHITKAYRNNVISVGPQQSFEQCMMINIYAYWQVTLVLRLSGINRFNLCNQVFRPWRFWYRWLPGTRNSDERSLLRGSKYEWQYKIVSPAFCYVELWSKMYLCWAQIISLSRCTEIWDLCKPVWLEPIKTVIWIWHLNLTFGLLLVLVDLGNSTCHLPMCFCPSWNQNTRLWQKPSWRERELAAMTTEEEAWSRALFLGVSEWGCGCVPRWMLNACRGKISNPFSCWVWWIPVSSRVSANCKQDFFSCILHCLQNEHVKDLEILEDRDCLHWVSKECIV